MIISKNELKPRINVYSDVCNGMETVGHHTRVVTNLMFHTCRLDEDLDLGQTMFINNVRMSTR